MPKCDRDAHCDEIDDARGKNPGFLATSSILGDPLSSGYESERLVRPKVSVAHDGTGDVSPLREYAVCSARFFVDRERWSLARDTASGEAERSDVFLSEGEGTRFDRSDGVTYPE